MQLLNYLHGNKTLLLEVLNDLTSLYENIEDIDIIYIDFSKVFGTVPHQRLFRKM